MQELRGLQPVMMKFRIECDLKEFERALIVLASDKEGEEHFEQALQVVRKNRLFKQALKLYSDRPHLHAQVQACFADYLLERDYT